MTGHIDMTSTNDKQNFIGSLHSMVSRQKAVLFAEFEKEQAIAREEFAALVEKVLLIKEKQLRVFARQLETSDEPLDRQELTRCRRVQSLMCLKYKQGRSITPGSLRSAGYIQTCTAVPQDLLFVEDYRLKKLKKGDCHKVYYECAGSYDPCLINFLTATVYDASNKELNTSNRDLLRGVYLMEFVAGKEGIYSVHVLLYGQHISGSPFHIEVCGDSPEGGSEPPALGWNKLESGDGPDLSRPPVRAVTQEPSGQLSHGYEICDDPHDRRPEQPPVRRTTQAANLEVPLQKHKIPEDAPWVPPKPNDLGTSVNIAPKPLIPLERPVLGFSTTPTVVGHMATPKPSEQKVMRDASSNLKALGAGTSEVPSREKTFAPGDLCSECLAYNERKKVLHRSSSNSSMSVMQCSAPPVDGTRKACPPTPSSYPVAKTRLKEGSFIAEFVFEFDYFGQLKFSYPIGVTVTAHNVIILTDTGNDRVLMFDCEGHPMHKVSLPDALKGFKRPSAVVAQEDGTFAVKDDKCVYMFSRQGEFIRTLGRDVLSRPYGLALHRGENLLTLSLGESPPALRTYCMVGGFETVNPYGPLLPYPPHGSKCRFMEVHSDDLFVSELGLSSIYKTNLRGETVKIFGKRGSAAGSLNEPSGLSATEDYLFVGDSRNDRVQVFDFDGNFISVVKMRSPIHRPSGLYVSPGNTLYVVNHTAVGKVGMYQLTSAGEP